MPYALGLDFGTLSCRALLLNLDDPKDIREGSCAFEHGVLSEWLPDGTRLEGGDWALQDASDYLPAAHAALADCLAHDDPRRQDIVGIGIDFTASSPLPASVEGIPLSKQHPGEPHAYVKLWKHHRAEGCVERIQRHAGADRWLKNYGGQLSCEWLVPKALELAENAPAIFEEADCFVEAGDWVVQQLTGNWTRNLCAAGFKGMWTGQWPDARWFEGLHPAFSGLRDHKLRGELLPPGTRAGSLTATMAKQLGLPAGIPVSAATIDAHSGLLGMGIRDAGSFGMIMGTSACQLFLDKEEKIIPGVMGVVRDGILPGHYAYEAGQAAVGDLFSFFLENMCPGGDHQALIDQARILPPGSNGHLFLDWVNGNRSVLLDPSLSGAVFGLTLNSRPHELYRSCLEATAFGCRVILDSVRHAGVKFHEVVACGGLTRNDLLMQIHADVLDLPVQVSAVEETVALGAAIYGAMAAGWDVKALTPKPARTFEPGEAVANYGEIYEDYLVLHDHFGRKRDLLKRLRGMRRQ
jgi:L-ribulokinase